jgi:predicted outer membrane repeat protein
MGALARIMLSAAPLHTTSEQVTNSRFVGNSAPDGNGGAIASLQDNYFQSGDKSNYRLTVTNSDVHANDAGGNGGGIYLNVSTATLTNNNLSGNHAALGRAVYASQSTLNGSNVTL